MPDKNLPPLPPKNVIKPHAGRRCPSSISPRNARCWLPYLILAAMALVALVVVLVPHQGAVAAYKLALMLGGGVCAYALDRALWPFAAPSSYLADDWRADPDADASGNADYPVVNEYKTIFGIAMVRQAVVVACGMLAVSLGL